MTVLKVTKEHRGKLLLGKNFECTYTHTNSEREREREREKERRDK
jgi:hypothetical protein